jgi:hypothetical protein
LIGTCESRRNAASASLASAAKAILNFAAFTKPKPSVWSMTNADAAGNPIYCWAVVSPASGASAET